MIGKMAGRRIVMIAVFLLLIAAFVEAAEQQAVMEIEGMTCDL